MVCRSGLRIDAQSPQLSSPSCSSESMSVSVVSAQCGFVLSVIMGVVFLCLQR